MEKWKKNTISGHFRGIDTGTEQSGTGTDTHCSVLTSVHILAITWSFLIRFE